VFTALNSFFKAVPDNVMPMKILYDISVLGLAHYHERARTGIYRVVSNVARGILASGEFDLHCFASLGNDAESRAFLAVHPEFSACRASFIASRASEEAPPSRLPLFSGGLFGWKRENKQFAHIRTGVCHSPFFPLPDELLANRRIAKVQTIHDLIPLKMPHLFAFNDDELIQRVLAKLGPETFVICMSEATRTDLLEHKADLDPAKIRVVYSAASDNFYPCKEAAAIQSVREKYGIPVDARYFLSVCTLEPRKNIDHLIRSYVRLVLEEQLGDLYLVLTGTQGWQFDKIFEEVDNAADVRERIVLTGFVPDEDLAPLYSGALAFVYPSLYEGFGLPPLEAMQCGTPVITSNTSSLPEVVADVGILIDPVDGDALCLAMLNMYRDTAMAQELSRKSLARARLFSWDKCVNETIAVYRQALQQVPQRRWF